MKSHLEAHGITSLPNEAPPRNYRGITS